MRRPLSLAVVVALPWLLGAQAPHALDRVERALAEGRTADARQMLERWREEVGDSASREDVARSWYLRGRLALDGAEAELYYLRVVLDSPNSPYADDALLRLSQYHLALGNPTRAEEYLLRLRREYPSSELRPESLLWLSQAKRQAGELDAACDAATQGLNEAAVGAAELRAALAEALTRCRQPVRPPAVAGDAGSAYSVQVAALSNGEAARDLAARLRRAGFDAWVQDPGAGGLHRVRVGRGLPEDEARETARRLITAGYTAYIVAEERRR